jgi:Protein of unknown function DUF45
VRGGPVDSAVGALGSGPPTLWMRATRAVEEPVGFSPASVVTCADVVHRLWTREKLLFGSASVPGVSADRTRHPLAAEPAEPHVEIIRSARRRRTVSAYRDGDRTIVRLPAGMSAAEEQRWIEAMLTRLAVRDSRRRPSDAMLVRRAEALRAQHLPETAPPASVRWVGNQQARWGSCTVAERTIRISDRLNALPRWVLDYVLVHELAHLLVAEHDPAFWRLVDRYPQAARARGFLEGYATAAGVGPHAEPVTVPDAD